MRRTTSDQMRRARRKIATRADSKRLEIQIASGLERGRRSLGMPSVGAGGGLPSLWNPLALNRTGLRPAGSFFLEAQRDQVFVFKKKFTSVDLSVRFSGEIGEPAI